MDKKQYRRLIISVIFAIILIAIAIALLIVVVNKPKDVEVHNYIGVDGKDGSSITGEKGDRGLQGVPGVNGKDGAIITQTITQTIPAVIEKGEKGDPGEAGAPSPQLLVKVDYASCKLQTKYDGDDFWQVIAQLPKPCEVENGQ